MRRSTASILLAAITICGCGSTPLSTVQLRSAATRICATSASRTEKIKAPGSPQAGAAFLKRGTAVLKGELASLRGLRPPSALARTYEASLAAFSNKLDAVRAAVRGLEGGVDPVISIKSLQQQLGPIESAEDGGWRALGIAACVNR